MAKIKVLQYIHLQCASIKTIVAIGLTPALRRALFVMQMFHNKK